MSITDLIPAWKGHGRRRAVDEVERLRENEISLLTALHAAGDDITVLQQKLTQARQHQAEAERVVVCQQADIDDLTAERDALAEEVTSLKTKFAAELATEANANAITVPIAIRDTSDPEDQATAPIDVKPLWKALGIGPMAAVTDPGCIPDGNTTLPLHTVTAKEVNS